VLRPLLNCVMPENIHRPMNEVGDPSEELDPLESEALARVRHLASGRATRQEIEATKRWGRQSAAHERALAEASLLWDRLGPAGRNLLSRRGEPVLPPTWSRPRLTRRAMIGGALAASAMGYAILRPPLGLWPSLQDMLADYHTIAGEQRKLTIGGGVQLTLNSETSLNVQSRSPDADRIELVSGEVAVATGPASGRQVVVVTGDGQARAQQARFDVRHDPRVTCIACLVGEVAVERQASAVTLRAGQQVVYATEGLAQPRAIDANQVSAWENGLLIFHSVSLRDVVAELNRYRSGRILVVNPELGSRLVNGRFRIDNIDAVLAMFQQIFGAKTTRLPGGIVLLS
jgi:transmembrane sensor